MSGGSPEVDVPQLACESLGDLKGLVLYCFTLFSTVEVQWEAHSDRLWQAVTVFLSLMTAQHHQLSSLRCYSLLLRNQHDECSRGSVLLGEPTAPPRDGTQTRFKWETEREVRSLKNIYVACDTTFLLCCSVPFKLGEHSIQTLPTDGISLLVRSQMQSVFPSVPVTALVITTLLLEMELFLMTKSPYT